MLTITTTHNPATDLGFLLHKHPDRVQEFKTSHGKVHVFYPEATPERCTVAVMLEIDPLGLTSRDRRSRNMNWGIQDYVNDIPYTTTSLFGVALADVFSTAMNGRCVDRPELVKSPIPLEVKVSAVRSRRGSDLIRRFFEPLGYEVECETPKLDPMFPEWGDSQHHDVTLKSTTLTLQQVLQHLNVLLPTLDSRKHYFVGKDEVTKLMARAEEWLPSHPEKTIILNRYLSYRRGLSQEATARLDALMEQAGVEESGDDEDETTPDETTEEPSTGKPATPRVRASEQEPEPQQGLHSLRMGAIIQAFKSAGAESVLDLGCGEGALLQELKQHPEFKRITAFEVSERCLRVARRKINQGNRNRDRDAATKDDKFNFIHGSLQYRDERLAGHDAAAVMEVIEHIDLPKLDAFADVLFGCAKPGTVAITTPNVEYNQLFLDEGQPARLRHRDHRFEWTRDEFRQWCESVAQQYRYGFEISGIGEEHEQYGPPTQMAVFSTSR